MNRKEDSRKKSNRSSSSDSGSGHLSAKKADRLYKIHLQGAYVRSGSCLFIWTIILCSFLLNITRYGNFIGMTACIFFLIAINPPTLMILKRVRNKRLCFAVSVLINVLELMGYTSIIYFVGGIHAIYLSLAYAALIAYVGTVAPKRFPFIIAVLCSLCLLSMVILEFFGFIPHQYFSITEHMPLKKQLGITMIVMGLLFIVAYITSYTSNLLRITKHNVQEKNRELVASKRKLVKIAGNLRAKNKELKAAAKRAKQADRIKSEFIANMSHELRTPLNHIIGFSELIVDGKFGALNREQREFLGDVLTSGKHLLSLINDILDISKIEAGRDELEISYVDFEHLIGKCTMLVKEQTLKNGLQIHINIEDLPGIVSGDKRKLKQVLVNLLANAAKFSSSGGEIYLTAKTTNNGEKSLQATQILDQDNATNEIESKSSEEEKLAQNIDWIEARQKSSFIEVSVQDSGLGIDQKDLKRIFEPFVQIDGSIAKKQQGTGLGLAICKNIIEAHGGKIWAESSGKQKGSKFVFTIPIESEISRKKDLGLERNGT